MILFAGCFMLNSALMTAHGEGAISAEQQGVLDAAGWSEHVGAGLGVWVSVKDQMLRLINNNAVVWQARCSTAAKGIGSEVNSLKTPLGWHKVVEKVGENAAWGQVFRDKKATKEIWRTGDSVKEDLVLTRVLVLAGLEPGKNKGGNVDSYARGIYIHGTNGEEFIGTPRSHGCIRLYNDDVIACFAKVACETKVLITE
jgi:hypothetical protein